MRPSLAIVLVAALFVCGAWWLSETEPTPPAAPPATEPQLGGYPLAHFYQERDRFLPATDPRTVPAAEADWLVPEDEVFGIVLRGRARAYPIPMISYHHVVNDVVAGVPVAVTY